MSAIELVIFDMDGLMFDTELLSLKCWQKGGRSLGFDIPEETIRRTIGRNIGDTQQIIQCDMGADFPFERARQLRDRLVLEHCERLGTPAKPGLYELLDFLDLSGRKKAVATSTEIGRGQKLLEFAGVLERFDTVVYGNMIERGKPHPDVFLKAAELCGTEPGRCLVLEDSPAGVQAAHSAGMPVIMIRDMVEPDEETIRRLTGRADTLHEIIPYLEGCK